MAQNSTPRSTPDQQPDEAALLVETLQQTWSAYAIDVDSLALSKTAMATVAAPSKAELPELLEAPASGGAAAIALGVVLGEGGMGVVHAATQTALERTVAVKMLRPGAHARENSQQLLREGRVTGLLEHPNVVPVHLLGRDLAGRPLIVMKRIDGTPWASSLDGTSFDERMTPAFLRTHLGHLRQVALAVHFAHSEGILHRDIKPDNVMIGAFGEVYLVDWGIAVRVHDGGPDVVPIAREVQQIEGTPIYMAPEMALGDGAGLGVWSDVYLLGATLHHVITGDGPHDGDSIRAVLSRAFVSPPCVYPPGVPADLVTIARQAMARDPSARYESAAAFAEALDEFLLHRGALDLCEEGERRAAELDVLARAESRVDEEVEALFHEARFAFEQASRSWPESARARDGRHALLESMIAFELRRSSPRAALALLRRHEAPPEKLTLEVTAAMSRLEAMERDADVNLGAQARARRAFLGAAAWGLAAIGCGILTRYHIYPIDHWRFAAVGAVFAAGSFLSYRAWVRSGLLNLTNRRVASTSLMVFGSSVGLWPVMGAVGVSMPRATVLGALVTGLLWLTVVFHVGKTWLPLPLSHLVVAVCAWFLPEYHFEIFSLTAVSIVFTAAWMRREAMTGGVATGDSLLIR